MFDQKHYVPILKWKQGESLALKELSDRDRASITPLVEIMPVPGDDDDDVVEAAAVDQYFAKLPEDFNKCWGGKHAIFVDLIFVQDGAATSSGAHPLDHLFKGFAAQGVQAIPVTGPERSADYQTAVSAVIARDRRGVCIRLDVFEAFDEDPAATLQDLLKQLGLSPKEVDLVVDFGPVLLENANLVRTGAIGLLRSLPSIADFRTLTLASGAFPENLSSIPGGSVGTLPRTDWSIWKSVAAARLPRIPTFADYTANHPLIPPALDPRLMQMSASIRYCHDDEWAIFRGFSVRDPRRGGFDQFYDLSRAIVMDTRYSGPDFSWGDGFIRECADRKSKGNASKWRQVATSHHIVFASRQIATHRVP